MANGTQDFINTFFQVENLKQQRQQQALMEHNSRVQNAKILTDIARLAQSQEGREDLIALEPELANLLGPDLAPAAQTMIEGAMMRGFDRMGEEERQGVEEVVAAREFTGELPSGLQAEELLQRVLQREPTEEELERWGEARQTATATGALPGQLARDLGFANLSPAEQRAATLIGEGLELSEMERNVVANWASQLNLDLMDLAQRGALGSVGLMLQAAALEMQAGAGAAANLPSPNTLFDQISQALIAIENNPGTPEELQIQAVRYNNATRLLSGMGLLPTDAQGNLITPLMPTEPDALTPGVWQRINRWWRGSGPRTSEVDPLGGQFGVLAPTSPQQLLGTQPSLSQGIDERIREIMEEILSRAGQQP